MNPSSLNDSARLPYLDGLRVAALLLLIPYHVGMYYVSWGWHVKSPLSATVAPLVEPFMLLSSPWRLGLLFLVAGAACQILHARQGGWGLLRERSQRLLLPLLFGMAVVVVPQAYYELKTQAPELLPGNGGFLDFWAAYLGLARICKGDDCLDIPTWNHLWFLPYLWLYAALAAALVARPLRLPAWASRPQLPAWTWWLLPALPLVLFRWLLMPWFPSSHDFFGDFYNHAQYGYLFALGWASRSVAAGLWPAALRGRWLSLGLALLAWALLVRYFQAYAGETPPAALRQLMRAVWVLMAWWSILAACGWAQRAFRRDSPSLRAAAAAVFCVYVLHQTLIVVFSQWLAPLGWPAALEAPALVLLTLLGSLLGYALLRRVPGLRVLLGIQAGKGARPPVQAQEAAACSAAASRHS